VKFKTFGCASAIASSSALTEMIKGMTLEEAERSPTAILRTIWAGFLKRRCIARDGEEALELAIANYKGQKIKKEDFEVICNCFGVTDREIIRRSVRIISRR